MPGPVQSVGITWEPVTNARAIDAVKWSLVDTSGEPLAVRMVPNDADQDEFNRAMLELTTQAYRYLKRDDE